MFKKLNQYALCLIIALLISGCGADYLDKKYRAKTIFKDPQVLELTLAAKEGDIETINKLISEGVDINAEGERGYTPLYWIFAYVKPNPETKKGFEHLLKNGANAMQRSSETMLPLLHFSAKVDDPDYLKLILEHGQDLDLNHNNPGYSWSNPLLAALISDQKENFIILTEAGADLNALNINGEPIFEFVSNGHWDIAWYMLKNGANYNAGNKKNKHNPEGKSALVQAIEFERYFPETAVLYHGEDYREKIIKFLREEKVELYPWYPEDDPRYNPRP